MSIAQNFGNVSPSLLLDFANTKQLDNRVTFTRSTPAVFYDGRTTAMAEQNLLSYSQQFDNGYWAKWNSSITANSGSAPDGTTTADKIVENTATTLHGPYVGLGSIGVIGQSWTLSVYAKSAGRNFIIVSPNDGAQRFCWFDLSTGVVGTNNSGGTATITSIGSGWYRCSVTRVITGASLQPEFYTASANGTSTYTGDGTSGVEVWGAQLEQRSSATAYTATTTQPITNYIPVLLSAGGNQPRFDCNPTTGESLGLLIEAQRTNKAAYSSDFSNAYWQIDGGGTLIANQAVAPDGSLTADIVRESTASGISPRLIKTSSWADLASTTFTFSIYAKSYGTKRNVFMLCQAGVNAFYGHFDIVAGTFVQGTNSGTGVFGGANIENEGNGWFKISITGSIPSTDIFMMTYTEAVGSTGFGAGSYTGNGFSGVLYWGAQTEVGAFATSYIATTSASATRTADVAQMTGTNFSSWFNNAQGTFVAIVGAGNVSASARVLKVSDSDANRLIDFYLISSPSQEIYSYQNGIVSANFSAGTISTSKYLTAVSYATGNISALVNGGSVTTSTSAVVSSVANSTLAIGYDPITNTNQLARPIAKIAYYPIQVTSAQLQALTS